MRSKYGNTKVVLDGITFDSKREAKRWQDLLLLEKSGAIANLSRQVKYELAPAVKLNGKTKRALTYILDFQYYDEKTRKHVYEDSKGCITDVFRVKQHLMRHIWGIDILLT